MSDFDDVPLDKTDADGEPPRERSSSGVFLVVGLGAVLLVAAVIGYFTLRKRDVAPGAEPGKPAAVEAPPTVESPKASTEPLPPLAESDALVRDLVRGISSSPKLLAWLATKDLIRTITVVVANVAEGVSPAKHLALFAPQEKFRVENRRGRIYVDPKSYARYDALADAVASLDSEGCARAYQRLKPLFAEAYRELGHQDNFDGALQEAFRQVFETPVVEDDIPLLQPSVAYEFSDRKLEALTPTQKHLLRMGPRNVRLIQAKVREIAVALGTGSVSR